MKKTLPIIVYLISNTSFSQVGINTETPQKTLHIEGSLQLTNELNVGGTSSTIGDPGVSGQFLVSEGPNLAPTWKTINIPILDDNSYKLKGVYIYDLLDPFTNTNNNYLSLGNFNNIKVESTNNYIVIDVQSTTSVLALISGEGMSYRYRLSGNNGTVTSFSPFFYITYELFTPANKVTSYRFFLQNITPNTYNFSLAAMRSSTAGASSSKYIHFNRNYSDATQFVSEGKSFVYVYEK